ncbi:hypothetical protein C8Q77DRAFT_1130736 [Trametes polyzona]|nr:hypothetical protein C8Q77DRAFT_1130736 [Trametes polyzona]
MSESDVLYLVRTAHGHRVHTLASSVWLLYDLLTTFDQEVEFVWRSANTLPKYLYLVSRYIGLFGQFTLASQLLPVFCRGQLITWLILDSCLILSIELSLMLRIDALYGSSRRIRTLLSVAFLVEVAMACTINGLVYPGLYAKLRPFPSDWPIAGCFFPPALFWSKLSWAPILVFETFLFCLNAAKCISYGGLDQTPLIYRLFRDGTAYFAIAFAFMLACIITQLLGVSAASSVMSTWISAVLSYSGCHLLLSVRSVAAQRERLDLTFLCSPASDMHSDSDDIKASEPSNIPYTLDPPRISLHHQRVNSIELVPRPAHLLYGSECTSEGTHSTPRRSADGVSTYGAPDASRLERGEGWPHGLGA